MKLKSFGGTMEPKEDETKVISLSMECSGGCGKIVMKPAILMQKGLNIKGKINVFCKMCIRKRQREEKWKKVEVTNG